MRTGDEVRSGAGVSAGTSGDALLVVDGLTLSVGSGPDAPHILQDVSFTVRAGEARGFVGESGSGKSLTLRAIMGILPPAVRVTAGTVTFEGQRIVTAGKDKQVAGRLAALRGAGISMIFQEPSVALNPVTPVGEQIIDAVRRRNRMSRKASRDYTLHLMELVGIADPVSKIRAYPFELSGGLRQRVMIAAAVAGRPRLILCDEPTTALDVTIQQQILSLFAHLRDELDAALLYVTHDLAVVAQLCDTLTVLYSGSVMESRSDLLAALDDPRHPYTRALLDSTPDIDLLGRRLRTIPGTAPTPAGRPDGCPFAPRCERVQDDCRSGRIPGVTLGDGVVVACRHPLPMHGPVDIPGRSTAQAVST